MSAQSSPEGLSTGKGRLAGVFGGAVASICCVGPPAALAIGAGTGSIFVSFGRYRPLFLLLGVLVTVLGAGILSQRARRACPLEQRRTWYGSLLTTAFWAFAVTALLGRVIIPRIIEHF